MNKLAIALPCLISGLLLGAMTLTHAQSGPALPFPDDLNQPQSRASNIISVLRASDTVPTLYGCFAGADLLDCVLDPVPEFDNDNSFKLLTPTGSLFCGSAPMVQGATCTYSNAVFGAECDGRCGYAAIAADQAPN